MWVNQYNHIGLSFSLDLGKECVLTCAWNFKKPQNRKWFKSVDICGTGTRFQVSCVRGKHANHIHHARFMILLKKFDINIYKIYIHFLYSIIQNTSQLWPCLTSAFKATEVDIKYVLLLPDIFFHQKTSLDYLMGWSTNTWNIYCPKLFIDARYREKSFTMW